MFVEAVKAHREGAPPQLAEQIRCFIVQEVNHSREHIALNRIAAEAGYDMAKIDRHVEEMLDLLKGRPVILDLAATMALEHYTAMMAHEFLAHPEHFAGADPEVAALWRWHAIEEIEHKAVAYDTWRHATRNWSRWRRWKVKSADDAGDHQELPRPPHQRHARPAGAGRHHRAARRGGGCWPSCSGNPGVLRRIFPAWLAYFMPGFHPWNLDDRALIAEAERELEMVSSQTSGRAHIVFDLAVAVRAQQRLIGHAGRLAAAGQAEAQDRFASRR